MPNTPLIGAPYPAYTATRDVPADIRALGEHVEKFSVMRFTSAGARDAAITAPVEGMLAYIGGGVWTGYDGSAWVIPRDPIVQLAGSSVCTGQSGLSSVTSAVARTRGGGSEVYLSILFTLTADIAPNTSANVLGDPQIGLLASALRPTEPIVAIIGSGAVFGDVAIAGTGEINIRTLTATAVAGQTLRITAEYMR